MQTYPSRRLLANSLANEINTIKNEPGFGYSDILHETSDGVQLLALLCSINPISDDQSLRQAFHSIGLLLFTLKSFCSFFPFFFEGTSRRCCKWMKIKQRLCLLVWNQCSYTVGGNYRSYVWAFSSLMDSTCIWWINITVLKFHGLNYVYTIIFQEFKRKEIKVSSGLRNGSIFTQAASCLLTT